MFFKEASGSPSVYEDDGGWVENTGRTLNVPYPTTVNENDILIIASSYNSGDIDTTLSGWNLIYNNGDNSCDFAYWWKRANGTETGNVTITDISTSIQSFNGIMFRFSGCTTSGTPYESLSGNFTTGSTINLQEIISTDSNRLATQIFIENRQSTVISSTYSNSYSNYYDAGTGNANKYTSGVFTLDVATASTVLEENISTNFARKTSIGFMLIPQ